jgi:hypothetical protein
MVFQLTEEQQEYMATLWERYFGGRFEKWETSREDSDWLLEHEAGRGAPSLLDSNGRRRIHEQCARAIEVIRGSWIIVLAEGSAESAAESTYIHHEPLNMMVVVLSTSEKKTCVYGHYKLWKALSNGFHEVMRRTGECLARGELVEATLTCIHEMCAIWKPVKGFVQHY